MDGPVFVMSLIKTSKILNHEHMLSLAIGSSMWISMTSDSVRYAQCYLNQSGKSCFSICSAILTRFFASDSFFAWRVSLMVELSRSNRSGYTNSPFFCKTRRKGRDETVLMTIRARRNQKLTRSNDRTKFEWYWFLVDQFISHKT